MSKAKEFYLRLFRTDLEAATFENEFLSDVREDCLTPTQWSWVQQAKQSIDPGPDYWQMLIDEADISLIQRNTETMR